MPDERIWTVEAHPQTGEVEQEELAQELLGLVPMLTRLGGGVSIVARRAKDDETGLYYTDRVDIGWTLHAPLPKRPKRQEAPQEPVEAPAEPAEVRNGAEESEPALTG